MCENHNFTPPAAEAGRFFQLYVVAEATTHKQIAIRRGIQKQPRQGRHTVAQHGSGGPKSPRENPVGVAQFRHCATPTGFLHTAVYPPLPCWATVCRPCRGFRKNRNALRCFVGRDFSHYTRGVNYFGFSRWGREGQVRTQTLQPRRKTRHTEGFNP